MLLEDDKNNMRLKRWESPRREGRNDKGRGGAARQRQLKKRNQMLRKKLKEGNNGDNGDNKNNQPRQGEENLIFSLFFCAEVAPTSLFKSL